MKHLAYLAGLTLACSSIHAADTRPGNAAQSQIAPRIQPFKINAVTSVGPAQAGYVHYFLLTHPDGSLEYQVGVEMDDQRIAWSFPNAGVTVSEFIKNGTINVNDKSFKIAHLHGIRPFQREAEMRLLQSELTRRVAQWVDDQTPYCLMRERGQDFCLSCGDFVVRILYPGSHPLIPALPRDFLRTTGPVYTTDDLLLYFIGLHDLPDRSSMLAALSKMELPAVMREDLIAMIGVDEPAAPKVVAAPPPVAPAVAQKPAAKPANTGRVAVRRQQARKL